LFGYEPQITISEINQSGIVVLILPSLVIPALPSGLVV